jgi:predicted hotdog family 3-hydroxylacyl-ACP dehydratase
VLPYGDDTVAFRNGVQVDSATAQRLDTLPDEFGAWLVLRKQAKAVSVHASLLDELAVWQQAVGLSAADRVLVRSALAENVEGDLAAPLGNISAV